MPTVSPLMIDLSGVARLAAVQRPVASVWRTRFASTSDPFPPAVGAKNGRPLFDAMEIALWLGRTEHGNNPDAVADAAASAAPAYFDITDASHVASVDALLALHAATGEPVGGSTSDELRRRAAAVDPDDLCLATEISDVRAEWPEWADRLTDAAYSPSQASQLLERRYAGTTSSAGSYGPITDEAAELLVALTDALMVDHASLILSVGMRPSMAAELTARLRDDLELVVPASPESRAIRRRLLCEGLGAAATQAPADAPRLHLARFRSTGARTTLDVLRAVDELVLGMRDHDRAIVVAPASILTERLTSSEGLSRTDVLRSGRVRSIVKLPVGLVISAPRETLALWVLGRETGDVPIADRFTAVADLTDTALSPAARSDLTSDVLAAMGSARDVRAHSFRFAQLVRTTSLLASRGGLVTPTARAAVAAPAKRELPALLDQVRSSIPDGVPSTVAADAPAPTADPATVDKLVGDRHLRVIAGTRLDPEEHSATGLVVVGADDLDDHARIGTRRVDPLVFAQRHPSARLSVAGDVVFRTSPTPKAWVDPDGSKVVMHPARILRIDASDPGGLVPELMAIDIDRSTGGPGSWRRWLLRRIAPQQIAPLRTALADLAARRKALEERIETLDAYTELLAAGITSGVVALSDTAAAASDPQ